MRIDGWLSREMGGKEGTWVNKCREKGDQTDMSE